MPKRRSAVGVEIWVQLVLGRGDEDPDALFDRFCNVAISCKDRAAVRGLPGLVVHSLPEPSECDSEGDGLFLRL